MNNTNTFCISLLKPVIERQLNSRDNFSKQAKDFGLDFSFSDSIDCRDLQTDDNIDVYTTEIHIPTIIRGKDNLKFKYTPNECDQFNAHLPLYYIGCSISHLLMYERLLFDSNNPYYLIFEDDFIFTKNYNSSDLMKDIRNLPSDFDMGLFAVQHSSCKPLPIEKAINDDFYKCQPIKNGISGTSMYIISKTFAKTILDYSGLNVSYNADYLFGFIENNIRKLNIYQSRKNYGYGHLERMNWDKNIIEQLNLNF